MYLWISLIEIRLSLSEKCSNRQELHKHIIFICGTALHRYIGFRTCQTLLIFPEPPLGRNEMCVFHCELSVRYLPFSATVKEGSDISPLLMTACGLDKDSFDSRDGSVTSMVRIL